jgi:iron complex transport system permease protein
VVTSGSKRSVVLGGLLAALAVAVVLGVVLGAVRIPLDEVVSAVEGALSGERLSTGEVIVVGIRIPRVLLAALVGACLGAAGTLYQALFRNPLADPYIIGVSAGAGLAVAIAFALGADALAGGAFAVPAAAFLGAVATLAVVVGVATRRGRVDQTSLLLGGVAISFTLAAVTSLVMVVSRETTTEIVFWMMGGLTDSSWAYVAVITPMLVAGLAVPMATRRQLNVMLLGEERASQLGVSTERLKLAVLASASLLVAAAVSVAGLIAFVGLMTPHIARLILGPDHRLLLPSATLLGAVVLVLADVVARTIVAPIELPVGIVTAMLGGPFFIWLLVRGVRPG